MPYLHFIKIIKQYNIVYVLIKFLDLLLTTLKFIPSETQEFSHV